MALPGPAVGGMIYRARCQKAKIAASVLERPRSPGPARRAAHGACDLPARRSDPDPLRGRRAGASGCAAPGRAAGVRPRGSRRSPTYQLLEPPLGERVAQKMLELRAPPHFRLGDQLGADLGALRRGEEGVEDRLHVPPVGFAGIVDAQRVGAADLKQKHGVGARIGRTEVALAGLLQNVDDFSPVGTVMACSSSVGALPGHRYLGPMLGVAAPAGM